MGWGVKRPLKQQEKKKKKRAEEGMKEIEELTGESRGGEIGRRKENKKGEERTREKVGIGSGSLMYPAGGNA